MASRTPGSHRVRISEETGGEALASGGPTGGGTPANDGSATGGLASGGPAEDAPDEM